MLAWLPYLVLRRIEGKFIILLFIFSYIVFLPDIVHISFAYISSDAVPEENPTPSPRSPTPPGMCGA